MSMELYILSDDQLPSIDAWQEAIDANGFGLRLSQETPFSRLNGALPVQLGDRPTAFECAHWNASGLIAKSPDINFGHRWKYALALRWGADISAAVAAYMAAAAYSRATEGVVFDCEEGKIISPGRTRDIALDIERQVPDIEAAVLRAVESFRK